MADFDHHWKRLFCFSPGLVAIRRGNPSRNMVVSIFILFRVDSSTIVLSLAECFASACDIAGRGASVLRCRLQQCLLAARRVIQGSCQNYAPETQLFLKLWTMK